MTVDSLIKEVDAEIARWKKLRSSIDAVFAVKKNHRKAHKPDEVPAKRKLSRKARAAISKAAKARWAAQKKAAAK